MNKTNKYSPAVKERAVRLVQELRIPLKLDTQSRANWTVGA